MVFFWVWLKTMISSRKMIIAVYPIRWWWFHSLSRVWTVHSGMAGLGRMDGLGDFWQALLAAYLAGEAWWGSKGRSFVVALSVPFLCCLLEPLLSNVHTFPDGVPPLYVVLGQVLPWWRGNIGFLEASCVEHPWILITVPFICRHHRTVDCTWCPWEVFHQAFLEHVQPSAVWPTTPWLRLLAFQLQKGPQCWGACLAR